MALSCIDDDIAVGTQSETKATINNLQDERLEIERKIDDLKSNENNKKLNV